MKNQYKSEIRNQEDVDPLNHEEEPCDHYSAYQHLPQPNLYHFNVHNETEQQAVTRLDGEIRVCMRQYTINAIRDKHMELAEAKEMMKLYLKLVSQELKARDLAIEERLLNLREREMARKEAAAAEGNPGKQNEGVEVAPPQESSTEHPEPEPAATSPTAPPAQPPDAPKTRAEPTKISLTKQAKIVQKSVPDKSGLANEMLELDRNGDNRRTIAPETSKNGRI